MAIIQDISSNLQITVPCDIYYKRAYIQNGRVYIYLRLFDVETSLIGETKIGTIGTTYIPKGVVFGSGTILDPVKGYVPAQLEVGSTGNLYIVSNTSCKGRVVVSISYLLNSDSSAVDISSYITTTKGSLIYKRAYKKGNRVDIILRFSELSIDSGEQIFGKISNYIPPATSYGGGLFAYPLGHTTGYHLSELEVGSGGNLYTISNHSTSANLVCLSASYLLN